MLDINPGLELKTPMPPSLKGRSVDSLVRQSAGGLQLADMAVRAPLQREFQGKAIGLTAGWHQYAAAPGDAAPYTDLRQLHP
jgi:hypothetical protein